MHLMDEPNKPSLSHRIIFGLGSGFLLGLSLAILLAEKLHLGGGSWQTNILLATLFIIFFLIGYFRPELVGGRFARMTRARQSGLSEEDLSKPILPIKTYIFIVWTIGCVGLLFTQFANAMPYIYMGGVVILFLKESHGRR